MPDLLQGLLLFGAELGGVLSIVLSVILFRRLGRRKREESALSALAEELGAGAEERKRAIADILRTSHHYGDDAAAVAEELHERERRLIGAFARAHLLQDEAEIAGLGRTLMDVTDACLRIGSQAAADAAAMEALKEAEEKTIQLNEQLRETAVTVNALVQEYGRDSGRLESSTAEEVLNAILYLRGQGAVTEAQVQAAMDDSAEDRGEAESESEPSQNIDVLVDGAPEERSGADADARDKTVQGAETGAEAVAASVQEAHAPVAGAAAAGNPAEVADEPSPEPATEEADAPGADDVLDVDALLAEAQDATASAPAAEAVAGDEPGASGEAAVDDIDALLAETRAETRAGQAVEPDLEQETDADNELDAADIDALLAESQALPGESAEEVDSQDADPSAEKTHPGRSEADSAEEGTGFSQEIDALLNEAEPELAEEDLSDFDFEGMMEEELDLAVTADDKEPAEVDEDYDPDIADLVKEIEQAAAPAELEEDQDLKTPASGSASAQATS